MPKLPLSRLKSPTVITPSLLKSARRSVLPPKVLRRTLKSATVTVLSPFTSPARMKPISAAVTGNPNRVRVPAFARYLGPFTRQP
jgi:hypothetical protein